MLDRALGLLIEGKASTEYVAMRGNKLKEIVSSKRDNSPRGEREESE